MAITLNNTLNPTGVADVLRTGENLAQYAAQLSSGNRLTSASTDVASLSISTSLTNDAVTYKAYNQALSEATSVIQVEDGGLQQVQSILGMLMQISTRATSGELTSTERGFLNLEFQQLLGEMDRIANTTNFNGVYLLNGGEATTTTTTAPPPTNFPPQLNLPLTDQTATEGIPFSYPIPADSFTDPDGDFLTYMANLSGGAPLPGFLTFNAGTQTFSGTPGPGDVGTYTIEVTASDAEPLSATDTFTLEVLPAGLNLTGTGGADLIIGGTGNDTIAALGGNDMIFSGAGDDQIDAGAGTEIINAGDGDDSITLQLNTGTLPASGLPITDNMVVRLEAGNTGSIAGHPGTVTSVNDQGAFNNDAVAFTGNVQSGADTINGINALTFNGSSILEIGNSANINTSNQNTRSIFMAFETGADVTSRQVLYEQGGGTNGFNMYIEGGQLHVGAWRGNGGTFDLFLSTPITANSTNVAGFVFDSVGAGSFTGYMNGASFGSIANNTQQASHTGAIGIGGMNNASRFDGTGGASGSGFEFQGKIGEFLNYQDATNPAESAAIQTYMIDRWATPIAQDTVEGGTGNDTVYASGTAVDYTFDASSSFTGVETFSVDGNNNNHNFTVDNGIFSAGTNVEGGTFTIDTSNSTGNITVDATGVSSNLLDVLSGGGDNTIIGAGNGNTRVSYANGGAVNVNLFANTATGNGTDTLLNINHIEGSSGNDTIAGSGDSDTLIGGDGDDVISDISIPGGALPGDNLVLFMDATVTADITGHPGNVTFINDQGAFNNDITAASGNVQSGVDDINGLNSLTFDGSSILGVADSANINLGAHPQRSIFLSFETGGDVNSRQVLYEEGGTVNGFNVFIDGGNIYFGAYKNTGGDFDIFHSAPIAPNTTYVGGSVFDFSGSGTFDAYLNGVQIGSSPVGLQQSAHSGDIGIGGMRQDSRFFDGSVNGNGFEYTGEIGELLNYRDALTATEIQDVSNFLMSRRFDVQGEADSMVGGNGNDTITGAYGNDTIDGGFGNDRAIYGGNIADYTITDNGDGTYTITDNRPGSPDGSDLVTQVETAQFADGTVALNVNNPPDLAPAGPFLIPEDSANGTPVGTVSATDPDLNNLTYSIQSGNTGNVFSIDPNTGAITVGDNTNLDYETLSNYNLVIRATDDGPNPMFDEETVNIIITDITDTVVPGTTTTTVQQDELTFQSSLNTYDTISVKINDVRTSTLFSGSPPNVATVSDAHAARGSISTVTDQVIAMRADMGATQSRVDAASSIARVGLTNTLEAKGKLADTDIAKTSTDYALEITKHSASTLIAAQATQLHSGIVKMLFDQDE